MYKASYYGKICVAMDIAEIHTLAESMAAVNVLVCDLLFV